MKNWRWNRAWRPHWLHFRFPKTTCTVTQWGKLFSFQPLNVKSLWHVWQYLIHSSINDIETQEACVEVQWCVVLLIFSCEKMKITNYTSHDFIYETLYIVAYYRFYAFLFLDFLTNFSPECVEWKLNGIPCVTVNIHILTLKCFSCSDAVAFLNL